MAPMKPSAPADLGVVHRHADVNGIRMHYVEAGEGARSPAVVLLHGFPEMWWSWRYQIPALAKAGYRVIAPDLRGYNETDAKGPYDIGTLRDDVVALLDHCGVDRAVVVAHDWGGTLAWHLVSTRQDRCLKLVAMNGPHPLVMQRALYRWSQLRRSWYIFFFQIPWLPEHLLTARRGEGVARLLRASAVDKTNFGREELEPFVAAVQKPGRAEAMVGWYRAAIPAGIRAQRAVGSRGADPPPITIPALFIWGMNDAALSFEDLVPPTKRYAPGLEIHTIANCGHFVQQERPEEVNRVMLEWIRR